jgi:hypothetical protein
MSDGNRGKISSVLPRLHSRLNFNNFVGTRDHPNGNVPGTGFLLLEEIVHSGFYVGS